jgi:hypothetical protein
MHWTHDGHRVTDPAISQLQPRDGHTTRIRIFLRQRRHTRRIRLRVTVHVARRLVERQRQRSVGRG